MRPTRRAFSLYTRSGAIASVACWAVLAPARALAQSAAPVEADSLHEAVVYTTLRPPNWDVYLFEDPGAPPRPLAEHPALDYNAVFSPDGRWVVFTSERSGGADLWALDLDDDGPPVRLTNHAAMDDAAAFSPDGQRIAFVSTRDGYADVFVMPFSPGDTTAETRAVNLTRRPGGDFNPTFSPDGRHIAFSRQERLWASADSEIVDEDFVIELYVMDADGSNVRRLSEPELDRPRTEPQVSGSPAWSDDGQTIYYYRTAEEGLEIRRIRPDGSGDMLVMPDGFSPATGPAGRIAFVRPTEGGRRPSAGDVVSIAADGSDLRIETAALDSCFAPDIDERVGRMLCHGPGPVAGPLLPDQGRAFAPAGAMGVVDLGDRTLLVRGVRGFFPALTPEGRVLSTLGGISAAATRAGRTEAMTESLHISALDGSGLRALFTPPSGVAWGAAVSGDGGWGVAAVGPPFASTDAHVDIWKFRLDGSEPVNLTPDAPANDALPHISADGRRIVFRSGRDGDMAVYVMDGDGENVRRLTDTTARETMPALSPDGDWVVFTTDGAGPREGRFVSKLWLQRVDGSEGRLVEPERANIPDLSMHPRFSPDGRWIVFTSNRGGFNDEWPLTWHPQPYGDLWAVPATGGPAVRLTADKWEDGPNDWGYVRVPAPQR